MNLCTHPRCVSPASSRSPLYCWGHYIEHVLLLKPCPGAPKRVRLTLRVSTGPLRERIDALVARSQASVRTNDGLYRTRNSVAVERGMAHRTLAQVFEQDTLRWDVADRIACKLGIPVGTLYGHDWTAMDVEDAA